MSFSKSYSISESSYCVSFTRVSSVLCLLFLRILWSILFPWFLCKDVCSLNIGDYWFFFCDFCILLLCWKYKLAIEVFLMVSFGFLCIKACHLYIKLFWFFLFLFVSLQTQSNFFLFFCLRFEALYSKGMKKLDLLVTDMFLFEIF